MFLTDYVRAHLHHDDLARGWHRISELTDDPRISEPASAAASFHADVAILAERTAAEIYGEPEFDDLCIKLSRDQVDGQESLDLAGEALAGRARRIVKPPHRDPSVVGGAL